MNEKAIEAAREAPELIRRAADYINNVGNRSDVGPHHLISDLAACLGILSALPPLRAREEIAPGYRELLQRILPLLSAVAESRLCMSAAGDLRRDVTAILSRTAGQEWRDISSAPKDGRDLWLWKFGWEKAAVGGWVKKSFTNDGRDLWMLYGGHVVEPTHWLPYYRPAPPVAEPKAGDVSRETLAPSPDAPVVSRS
jgi:hypothetical protein